LAVELTPQATIQASDVRIEEFGSYLSIIAGGRGNDRNLIVLAISDLGLTGTILAGPETYMLVPQDQGRVLSIRVDAEALPPDATPVLVESSADRLFGDHLTAGALASSVEPMTLTSFSRYSAVLPQVLPGHTHELLAVYTDDVAATTLDPEAAILNAVQMANVGYQNSDIEITLNLAAAEEVAYDETGDIETDLDRLEETNDGFLDEVHRLRDQNAADLVALIVDDGGSWCGIANLHAVSSDADDDSAFAVVDQSCLTQSALAHELGHIGGAHHNTGNDPFPVPKYAHGWVRDDQFGSAGGWRSVMAYNSGECGKSVSCPFNPIYFSNPDKTVGNGPIGNSTANNSRRLNETAQALAGFRISGPRISLYEGGGGTQDHVCVVSLEQDNVVSFTFGPNERHCDNDEARSAVLYDVPAGRVVRLLDDPEGAREDDWIEVIVKRDVVALDIPTLEASFESDDARVTYHRNDGLDGKASRLEIDSASAGPTVDLYEGNDATENLVCSVPVGQTETLVFSDHPECDNDEARSLVLLDIPANTSLRFFDDPGGSRSDDWTEIEISQPISTLTLNSFEESFQQAELVSIYHAVNGLDGKVSRLEVESAVSENPRAELYEGNSATQDLVCAVNVSQPRVYRFPDDPECDNDEARSLILRDVPAGIILLLFDSPDAALEDDWTAIRVKRDVRALTIDTFEASSSSDDVDVVNAPNNGLDGKVSRLEVTTGSRLQGIASFYEGNSATQNKVCDLALYDQEVRFKGHASCDNDEARSLVLLLAPAGTVLRVFDDPDCESGDDVTTIETLREVFRIIISSFEDSLQDADIVVEHDHDNGLDGKVSCVQIDAP
jgi:hypothetical protein